MAIAAVAGKSGILTINSVTAQLTSWSVRISNEVIKYGTFSQTADANSVFWKYALAGMSEASIEVSGYWDSAATVANKWTGTTYLLRPGTTAAGSVVCSFVTGDAFTATVVVASMEADHSAESTKPGAFRATLQVNGAITYPT